MEKRMVSTEHLYTRLVRRVLERFGTEQQEQEGVGTLEGIGCMDEASGMEHFDPAFVPDGVALVFRGCGRAGDAGGSGIGSGAGWCGEKEATGWSGEAPEIGEGLGASSRVVAETGRWSGCGGLDGGGDAGGVSSGGMVGESSGA